MLTESVKAAGGMVLSAGAPPVRVNRILDSALRYAPYLLGVAMRGLIPKEDAKWAGLREIASAKAKSTALAKAHNLMELLGIWRLDVLRKATESDRHDNPCCAPSRAIWSCCTFVLRYRAIVI
ncbi:MAG: hypothetical protein LBI64_03615 [Coriobacteriales bacterium]|nr:hypothetical protein [Coriobacteriales bacterium]